jgi:putative transposase
MPRRHRQATGGLTFHIVNRGAKRAALFTDPGDYHAFERLLMSAALRFRVAVFAYCLMPNHWHFVIAPHADGVLSRFMHWLTSTHACRWHVWRGSAGQGAVYQGRYKAIPVSNDRHFLWVCRYVERNPLRAGLVASPGDWEWSSLNVRSRSRGDWLSDWPVPRPLDWDAYLRAPQSDAELEQLRSAIRRGQPFGDELWAEDVRVRLGIKRPGPRGYHRKTHARVLSR